MHGRDDEEATTTRDLVGDGPLAVAGSQQLFIDGKYRVCGVIGTGGMGAVYRARDDALHRDVAVKLIHPHMLTWPDAREAFVAEARAMARVNHPNVVTIHAFGMHGEQPYLVMEHVEGTSLASWLSQRRPPPLDEALDILDALCRGVEAIHSAGTLHRDLKPANVLVDPAGRVAVADFGLAGAAGVPALESASKMGTPAYLAPELARDEPLDPRRATAIDVYAIGMIAFELLTGARPFATRNLTRLLHDHAYTAVPRPSSVRATLTAAYDDAILRALAKAPANRTPTAAAFRRDLERARAVDREYPEGLRILSVDDEPGTLVAMRELLIDTFPTADVISVSNTSTAIAMAAAKLPDLVITDFDMPGGGAIELTRALRAESATEDIPIIVVTARGGAPDWHELKAMGANRFLVKPVDFDALAAMVRALVPPRRPAP